MKTALYARKSTESDDRQAQSIDDQIHAMEALARREGIRIDETYVEARSAKAPHTRPEFRRLTDDIEAGRVTRLVVWSMNRLSRNLVDGGLVAHLLQTGRLEWIRTVDRTYRPEDNALLLSIENGMATSFIQDLRKNVVRGMDGKADRGWRPGRAPLGYLNNPATREIDPDPVRFPLVRRAWDTLLAGGSTPSQIYHLMVDAGLTSRGSRQRVLPLTAGVVYAMFSNPFYKGSFLYRGEERLGKHRPVVTREEFDAAQRILGRGTLRRRRRNDFDYSGLLRCGRCGCAVVADRKVKRYAGTGRTVEYVYYHCSNGKGGCSKRGVREQEVERSFAEAFESIRIPRTFADWIVSTCERMVEGAALAFAASLVSVADLIAREERRLVRLRQMRVDQEISAEEFRDAKAESESVLARLRWEREDALGRDGRAIRVVREKVLLAAAAGGYADEGAARRRGMALGLGGTHSLTLGTIRIAMDPAIALFSTFEPLKDGSEKPKVGDLVTSTSIWYTFAADILTLAREAEKDGPGHDAFDRLESIKRYKGRQEKGWAR